ncbi:helix-turn-helix transcriptional regulator [Ochrovirga pacifica]|uniref:helix-turn-helix transcriptional regulator n=1 Tax=Ochrovirga pacifica TaxID=1042376 RepID=UPI0002E7574F|nr:hypothetical protein [Ochrovirga pacifica]
MMKISFFTIYIGALLFFQAGWSQKSKNDDPHFILAEQQKNINTKEAVKNYQKSLTLWEQKKDSIAMIRSLIAIARCQNNLTNYNKSYDNYWRALLIAEKKHSKVWEARIHQDLGYLYNYFERDVPALKHLLLALKINKHIDKNTTSRDNYILSNYLSIARFYRSNDSIQKAKSYLDSCYAIVEKQKKKHTNYYLEVEHAVILTHNNQIEKGLEILENSKPYFKKVNPAYLSVIYFIIGKTYLIKNDLEKSEKAFLKSLDIIATYKSHINYELYNYEELSKIYLKQQKYLRAYKYNNKAKVLNETIFGSKSENNKELFAVKDNYRVTKEKQLILEQKSKLASLENEQSINKLKLIILFVVMIFSILVTIVFIRNLRLKHQNEKSIIKEKQKATLEKQKEIIEVKNKELTSSALQLIEKDEFIKKLEKKLTDGDEKTDLKTIRNMVKSINNNPANNWQEFEARFIDINQGFFEKLKEQFPNLGPTDLKVCSLIKLNFSSKEMASLLGISIESVHTSRYRIRKKLGLNRSDNLSDFINSI